MLFKANTTNTHSCGILKNETQSNPEKTAKMKSKLNVIQREVSLQTTEIKITNANVVNQTLIKTVLSIDVYACVNSGK